jgi:hypothetical protein
MQSKLFVGLVVGLALLAGGSSVAADTAAEGVKKKLDTPITLKGCDSNTPLSEVLQYFREAHRLTIAIDKAAFAKVGLTEPESAPIRFVEQKDVPLGKVLKRLLDQLPATFKIQGKGIIIIPAQKPRT